jgi:uncharacterized protein (TIGR00290 family)
MRAFVSWSGGKDSCLSYYKADAEVSCLLNMATTDVTASMTHGLSSELLYLQSECLDMPLIQKATTWHTYEEKFREAVEGMKKDLGIEAGIFGDIRIEEHRQWVERICIDLDITPILPLWGLNEQDLLRELVDSGFKAVVVAAESRLTDYLGRTVDERFIDAVTKMGIDPCGENGEYHTFVTDGPVFRNRIEIVEGKKMTEKDHGLFRIDRARAEKK